MMFDTLYLLQFGCCLATLMLALMLAVSRIHVRWHNVRYEQSRWMLFAAMVLLAVHYMLQMFCDLRESGDDVGAAVNILFYMPVYFLVSHAALYVESTAAARRRSLLVSGVLYVIVVCCFTVGVYSCQSMHIGRMLYAMYTLFVGSALFLIFNTMQEVRIRHRRIEDQTGADMQPYVRYSFSGFILMCASALMTVFAVLSRTMLYVIAPIMFLSLFFFIMSFVALGYSITPIEEILEDDDTSATGEGVGAGLLEDSVHDDTCGDGETNGCDKPCELETERIAAITSQLEKWCLSGEFRNNSATLVMLSRQTGISRRDLTAYFGQYLHRTFRVWLSDIRMEEAQRLILAHPEYSNDAISAECGFSSRSQLYKLFRDRYGITPKEWREHEAH